MYDNELLVEFETLIDLDIALYRYIKDKYPNSEYVDQKFINCIYLYLSCIKYFN